MEFFSYACPHCYDFEPRLNAWAEENQDKIKFIRMPAVGTTYWITLGRAYFTMDELGILEENHAPLFDEIHRYGHDLGSLGRLSAWIDGKGTTEAAFTSSFNSSKVNRQMEIADQMARRLKIASVPAVVVNGKYLVQGTRDVGLSRMLDVVDYLVEKEMAPAEITAP
jgi:thiol:disulfide interchange protein DsbA